MQRRMLISATLIVLLLLLAGLPAAAQDANGELYLPFVASSDGQLFEEEVVETAEEVTAACSNYELIDLGTLGEKNSFAYALNDRGQVVGESSSAPDGTHHAFLWERGTMRDLDPLVFLPDWEQGIRSYATGINNRGQVIVHEEAYKDDPVNPYTRVLVWQKGVMTPINIDPYDPGFAEHLNNTGQVVGRAFFPIPDKEHAFLWEKGVLTELGDLGGTRSFARRVNERGQIIGQSQRADGANVVFLWEKGVMIDLGTLGGGSSDAGDINNRGQIVGNSLTEDNLQHAFFWQHGMMYDLGTLGGSSAYAFRINERGQVLGQSQYQSGSEDQHAFLWYRGRMTDLGTLGGTWTDAKDLNQRGQVVGWSYTADGVQRAFLWYKGQMVDLGALEPGGWSVATDINEKGEIVGYGSVTDPVDGQSWIHAILWDK